MRAEVLIINRPISSDLCFPCGERQTTCGQSVCVCVCMSRHFLLSDCVCLCLCPSCSQRAVEQTNSWNIITLSCVCVCLCNYVGTSSYCCHVSVNSLNNRLLANTQQQSLLVVVASLCSELLVVFRFQAVWYSRSLNPTVLERCSLILLQPLSSESFTAAGFKVGGLKALLIKAVIKAVSVKAASCSRFL